jgi:hypothetical protein
MSNASFKKRHLEYQKDLGFHGMDQQDIFRKRCGLMKKYNTMSVMHWESFVKSCNLGVLTQLVFLFEHEQIRNYTLLKNRINTINLPWQYDLELKDLNTRLNRAHWKTKRKSNKISVKKPAMKNYGIRMEPQFASRVDAITRQLKVNRNQFIRDAIERSVTSYEAESSDSNHPK